MVIEQLVQPTFQQGPEDWWLPWVNLIYDVTGTLWRTRRCIVGSPPC